MISLTVYGTPAPQGSKRPVGRDSHGRAILIEQSKKVKPWRQAVLYAAREAMEQQGRIAGPVVAAMVFTLRRPKTAPKRRRAWADKRPDLSKLIRSTEDALVDAGIIDDDAQIVAYSTAWKLYVSDAGALDAPGVQIRLWHAREQVEISANSARSAGQTETYKGETHADFL